jgi:glyoxylase-like metal-dependent hydrolase (beta-lactamase superfamily II)
MRRKQWENLVARRLSQPSPIRTRQLGDLQISYVPDGAVQFVPERWFPQSSAADWTGLADHLDASGHLVASIGALLIEDGRSALLIDAGYGPRHIAAESTHASLGTLYGGALLENLARLGRTAEQIDTIAFTHLHDDHVGWAFELAPDGSALFPKARYLATRQEWAGWLPWATARLPEAVVSRCQPVGAEQIQPGVRARPSPGHSAGHLSWEITSNGSRLLAFGDVMHSPVQIRRPEWGSVFDAQPDLATATRRHLVAELQLPGTLGFGNHFADVVFGRVVDGADGPEWHAEP